MHAQPMERSDWPHSRSLTLFGRLVALPVTIIVLLIICHSVNARSTVSNSYQVQIRMGAAWNGLARKVHVGTFYWPQHSGWVTVRNGTWYLFLRDTDWQTYTNVMVRVSTDHGQSWSEATLVATPPAGMSDIPDGSTFYDEDTGIWHMLTQCTPPHSDPPFPEWKLCHFTRQAPDPVGMFTSDPQNPVVNGGDLWSRICNPAGQKHCPTNIVDEGTPESVYKRNGYFYVTFHGFDELVGQHLYRGVARTADFRNWDVGETDPTLPFDAMFGPNDCAGWQQPCEGGGQATTVITQSHVYMLIETPRSYWCEDPNNVWGWSMVRAANFAASGGWQKFGSPALFLAPPAGQTCGPHYPALIVDGDEVYLYYEDGFGGEGGQHIYKLEMPLSTKLGGDQLVANQNWDSADGRFHLRYQNDGTLALYQGETPKWVAPGTWGSTPGAAVMQADGNLVVRDAQGTAKWTSGTSGHPGAWLTVQDDGNLVIYDPSGSPLWATGVGSSTVTLGVSKDGSGSGTVTTAPSGINCGGSCTGTYNANTAVTLTATPDSSSQFAGWSGDPDCSDGQVTMNAAKTCVATFAPLTVYYQLDIQNAGGGTVTSTPSGINCGSQCSATYESGTTVTLSAQADPNHQFDGWSGVGCDGGIVTMSESRSCTATFSAAVTFPLWVEAQTTEGQQYYGAYIVSDPTGLDCGSNCTATFVQGTVVTLLADPQPLYWSGDPQCRSGQVTMSASRHCVAVYDSGYFMDPLIVPLEDARAPDLTNALAGVPFDGNGDGQAERLSWTSFGASVGFLALDVNGNGTIDNGLEVFGVPASGAIHGRPLAPGENAFTRLSAYDRPEAGGNGDGEITVADDVHARLRLWVDRNHDGISQPIELLTLGEAGIEEIALAYTGVGTRDRAGNLMRYRGSARLAQGGTVVIWNTVLRVERERRGTRGQRGVVIR